MVLLSVLIFSSVDLMPAWPTYMPAPSSVAVTEPSKDRPFLAPSPPKQQMVESPSRVRRGKYKEKEAHSLRISKFHMDQLQHIQQTLTECGAVKKWDTKRINEK